MPTFIARSIIHLLEATSSSTGEDFFRALVRSMAEVLGTRYAFVGEVAPGERVQVRAIWTGAGFGAPFSYAQAGTPCANVTVGDCCQYTSDVQAAFPDDRALVEMGIHAYFGLPIRGTDGRVRGLLVAMDDQPREPIPELPSVLGVFAARAAAELERMDAEDALRASEARYRTIVSTCAEGVWLIDAAGDTTFVNGPMARMLGYEPAEMMGRPVFDFMDDAGRERTLANIERRKRGVAERHDFELRHRDGRPVQTWMATSPITDAAGGYAGAVAMVTDVTEQHALEARVREAEKLESLGLLAGGIAHDFNNLLVGVLGQSELGLRRAPVDHPLHGILRSIRDAAERAAELTRQLLAYAGKAPKIAEPVDLHRAIAEIAGLCRASAGVGVAIELELDPGPVAILADPAALTQVLLNLITNAMQALGDRGGTVTISTRRARLDVDDVRGVAGQPLPAGDFVVLEVRDDGVGMDAETCMRVFEPFFTTKRGGRGLGLAAVHGIVRSHGGSIEATSAPGRGSTFTVHLPIADGVRALDDATTPAAVATRGRGTILLADDEPMVREVVRLTLEELGFAVEGVGDGRAAIERFASAPAAYAAVMLDVTMPGLGGVEATTAIHSLRPGMPVVLMSGFTTDVVPADLAHVTFLSKPFRVEALVDALEQALG
ncbi:MAG: PAS domain S-box protein [Kofleriaceae bacterium]|nr:PAS domain S-box protein [Myxococcales bacterium]MCB9560095.1 PAS domain S-box protein [Kofleriaceae bacterium]MCB9571852.1 PAS domain S-box protein [Kofleriaceae bacterium]